MNRVEFWVWVSGIVFYFSSQNNKYQIMKKKKVDGNNSESKELFFAIGIPPCDIDLA